MLVDMQDRIRGALFGVAVGDALGAPLEFMDRGQIAARHGLVTEMIGGGWLSVAPGEITDDTQMTLAVAEGIIQSPDDPVAAVGRAFIRWIETGPKDVGTTCSQSIQTARRYAAERGRETPSSKDWFDASKRADFALGGKSAGNGSLMRTVYPGLYFKTLKERARHASAISRMTHHAELASEACILYSAMVGMFTEAGAGANADLARCYARCAEETGFGLDSSYALGALGATYVPKPTGFVVDSMRCALHCLLTGSGFEDAVVKAVNYGGDADTIGAITGGLAGAMYGFDAIPARWWTMLAPAVREKLDAYAQAALENRTS